MQTEINRLVKLDVNNQLLVSTKALCDILGVSKVTLSNWAKEGMPKRSTGWWCLSEVIAWRAIAAGKNAGGEAANQTVNARKLEADAKYKEIKAKKEEILLNALKGEYFEKDAIVKAWTERVMNLKKSLLMLPRLVASEFINVEISAQVEEKVEEYVREYLDEYARKGKFTPRIRGHDQKDD